MHITNHRPGCNTKPSIPTVHNVHRSRGDESFPDHNPGPPFDPAPAPIEDLRVARLPFKVLNSTALQINNLACTLGLDPSLIIEMAIDQFSGVTSGEMRIVDPSIDEVGDA
jgi:hypothetical protein